MAKIQIAIPYQYSRLYPVWTSADHKIFKDAYKRLGDQLAAFKALLQSHNIDYSELESND